VTNVPRIADRVTYNDEKGTVSSRNETYVFVKFDQDVKRLGWDGATAKACRPEDLKHE
jgi:hypothetical protein